MMEQTRYAPELEHVRVSDCMHRGILTCSTGASLREVAGVMAKYHVHAVAVTSDAGDRPVGVISALDVVSAAAAGGEFPSASQVAGTEPVSISGDESLHRAAQVMTEHGVSHLIVLDAAGGYPVGVLSTLDIASVYAGPEG